LDPRLKLIYYEENKWEKKYINAANKKIGEIYNLEYAPKFNENINSEINQNNDDFLIHIYRRKNIENENELQRYLKASVVSEKTDILQWWKVIINYCLY
jgi:hypothetical protein